MLATYHEFQISANYFLTAFVKCAVMNAAIMLTYSSYWRLRLYQQKRLR